MPSQLSPQQLAVVLRRAAELERRRRDEAGGDRDTGLSDRELEEVVREVGIPTEDVARALVELRAGALPVAQAPLSLADRLVGPEELAAERVVSGEPRAVERAVAEFLRSQLLEVRRDFGDRVQWGAAQGLLPGFKRTFDFNGRITLPAEAVVESLVAPLPGEAGQVMVRLVLRLPELRRQKLSSMGAMVALGAAIAGVGIAVASGTPELLAIAGGASAAVGGAVSIRGGYQRELHMASESLQRFLDGLEHRDRQRGA